LSLYVCFSPVHGLIFISKYFEEQLPDNFEQIDLDAENIVFTAQVRNKFYYKKKVTLTIIIYIGTH
jgi:hypothetical protein